MLSNKRLPLDQYNLAFILLFIVNVLREEIMAVFRKYPPFNFLGEKEIRYLVEDIALEYYPRGFKIFTQNGPPADCLRLIKKGAVKIYVNSENGGEVVIDYRSEGELFGFISLISGDHSRENVLAVEDTICYLIPRETVLSLMETSPSLNEYFLKSFFINFIDKTYQETRKRFSLLGEGEKVLFTTPVGDIIRREPVTANEHTSIKDAAKLMSREKISSLIIINDEGVPVGIITDKDLRTKVIARDRNPGDTVRTIMSSTLIRVDANEYCFEALLRMIRYNIHHLIVVENGRLKGLVSNHDFMLLQGFSPTLLVKEIEEYQDADLLTTIPPKFFKVVSRLLREGSKAYNLTGLITEVIEKIINKMADLIEKKIGPSPLPYTLFIYGDGGRRELTLCPHLQIGVIYEDTHNLTIVKKAEQFFAEFADLLRKTLNKEGLEGVLHAGGYVMPPEYIKSYSDWAIMFQRAASAPFQYKPEAELFDMRAIRGKKEPLSELRELLFRLAAENNDFMDYIATSTVENRPPLGFFRKLVVEKSGAHRNELNLYLKGIKPIVDAVRLFAIEKDIRERSTMKRTLVLEGKHIFEEAEDIRHALEYLFMLLLHNQIEQIESGYSTDEFVNPGGLGSLEKKTIKEIFQLIANLYELIEKGYRTERAP
jgi:CBS domain-containing protein